MDQQHTPPLSPSSDDGDPSAGLGRRDFIRRSAVVGGTLLWAAPTVQSLARPAFGQTANGTPLPCGRMTGGGHDLAQPTPLTRYGFTLYCSTAVGPNNLEVSFIYNDQQVNFHLDTLTAVACSDDPTIEPDPPDANFDTMDGTGTGHLTGPGAPGCTEDDSAHITFKLADGGEGPASQDFISFTIVCGPTTLLDVSGQPQGGSGNIQAHDTKGAKQC